MKFNTWLTTFCMAINARCVFTTTELRCAWREGRTPQDVAVSNDALCAEYDTVYGAEFDELATAA